MSEFYTEGGEDKKAPPDEVCPPSEGLITPGTIAALMIPGVTIFENSLWISSRVLLVAFVICYAVLNTSLWITPHWSLYGVAGVAIVALQVMAALRETKGWRRRLKVLLCLAIPGAAARAPLPIILGIIALVASRDPRIWFVTLPLIHLFLLALTDGRGAVACRKNAIMTVVLLYLVLEFTTNLRRVYLFDLYEAGSESMSPTIRTGQYVFADKTDRVPRRNQIYFFSAFNAMVSRDWGKRIIALPGDTVKISGGEVIVNSKPLERPEAVSALGYYGVGRELLVPAGCVYVLGDNTDHSFDSRHFGPVPIEYIRARVVHQPSGD